MKVRRSQDRIIFKMEIPIPGKTVFELRRALVAEITRAIETEGVNPLRTRQNIFILHFFASKLLYFEYISLKFVPDGSTDTTGSATGFYLNQRWPHSVLMKIITQIARFMRPTWGQPGANRTQLGHRLVPWILLSRNGQSHGIDISSDPKTGVFSSHTLNTLRPRENGRRFTDDTFKLISLNENVRISIEISLTFVPKDPINNIIQHWFR